MSARKPTKCVRCSGRKRPAPGTRWGAGCDLQAEESEGAGPLQGDTSRRRGPEDARRLGRRESRWTWRGPGRGVWASSLG